MIDDKVTVLVGMNEAGKTAILECVAKANYFEDDSKFKFDMILDYPRKDKKSLDKTGEVPDVVKLTYEISEELLKEIADDIGENLFTNNSFSKTSNYNNKSTVSFGHIDFKVFLETKLHAYKINDDDLKAYLEQKMDVDYTLKADDPEKEEKKKFLTHLKPYLENKNKWDNPIEEYVYRKHISPQIPKFLYYDEYYMLPSRISIEHLNSGQLEKEDEKTAKALFELAQINTKELVESLSFERFQSELEATQCLISQELFKYWESNKNIEIVFTIDKKSDSNNRSILEHILDIRVKNRNHGVSLPLKNRSKGFNWFFSFLVWFKKIQEDKNSNYVILLDEPGLNLHAAAQNHLMHFIEDLSKNYQIIYTTHSPFMIDPTKLDRVRTVLETDSGTKISDTLQEKDPKTLFPLQAALGYDIAQNLFIAKNNLIVEGLADLVYLTCISSLLETKGKTCLNKNITITPVGGLDKVVTFVALLNASELKLVCLLDTFNSEKGKQRLDELVKDKVIKSDHVKFYHEYTDIKKADLEDVFTKSEYLSLFNKAFPDRPLKEADLNKSIDSILIQIQKATKNDRFNHYLPAQALTKIVAEDRDVLSDKTLGRFEALFADINKLFGYK